MSATRVLITGGAGFIGSHLARRLIENGHAVSVLDSLHSQVHGDGAPTNLTGCETIWGDVRDTDAVRRAMRGCEVVYHLAAETGVGQSQYEIGRYVSVNTCGTAIVLEAAVTAGVRHVVIASSRAVYGEGHHVCPSCSLVFGSEGRLDEDIDIGIWNLRCPKCGHQGAPIPMSEQTPVSPLSIYGVTKLQQEQLAQTVSRAHSLPVTILRLFNVFGPGQSLKNPYVGVLGTFFRRALAGSPVEVYEDGLMLRDFVFVSNVVDAFDRCLPDGEINGRILNVGTGQAITMIEVAEQVYHTLGLEPQLKVSGRYRSGDIRHAVADMSISAQALGYKPSTPFADGLRQFIDWALANNSGAGDNAAEQELLTRNLLRQGGRCDE
jgi:dTDP-L-rhamnose 4-epimerase